MCNLARLLVWHTQQGFHYDFFIRNSVLTSNFAFVPLHIWESKRCFPYSSDVIWTREISEGQKSLLKKHVTIFYSLKNSNGICWQILVRIFIIAYTLTTLCHCSIWDLKKKTKKQQECYKRNSFFKRLLLVLLLSLKLTFEIPATLLIWVSTIMNSQNVFGESWSPVIRWAWIEFLTSHRHINVRQQLIRFQTHNCASVVLKIIIVRATTVSCMSKL